MKHKTTQTASEPADEMTERLTRFDIAAANLDLVLDDVVTAVARAKNTLARLRSTNE